MSSDHPDRAALLSAVLREVRRMTAQSVLISQAVSERFGLSSSDLECLDLALLSGGATAICGASAALALYGIIGRDRLNQAQFALTLVGVSLASALAMSLYPAIAGEMGLTDSPAGFLIGASIHDVAQAIGGGFTYSDSDGAEATIMKLSRVAMLGTAMILVAMWIGNSAADARLPLWRRFSLPWFIVGFVAMVAINI